MQIKIAVAGGNENRFARAIQVSSRLLETPRDKKSRRRRLAVPRILDEVRGWVVQRRADQERSRERVETKGIAMRIDYARSPIDSPFRQHRPRLIVALLISPRASSARRLFLLARGEQVSRKLLPVIEFPSTRLFPIH